jgi:sulfite exporter TauE/SafE
MTMLWAAFITGLIGSLHCAGMCGPLICIMPINKQKPNHEIAGLVIYNTGRIISYGLLGVMIGSAGAFVSMLAGVWFAYISGAILILLGLYKLLWAKHNDLKMPAFVRRAMGRLLKKRSPFTLPILGMINGIIPCGAVYAALAGASVTANPWQGGLYMIIFGLSTWPAIFSSYYLSGKLHGWLKGFYRPATAIFLCLLGLVLIVRTSGKLHIHPKESNEIPVCR